MTHSPPLPAGNQSPYPIKELPLSERVSSEEKTTIAEEDRGTGFWIGLSAVVGIGALGLTIYSLTRSASKKSVLAI